MSDTAQNPAFDSTEVGRIDSSLRTPGLLFTISGAFWLFFSGLVGLFAMLKLVAPSLLDWVPFLTYGRVKAVAVNALTHGWATNVAFALVLWIMSRLSERAPDFDIRRYLVVPAGVVYNILVTLGILGIFWGEGRPFFLLEMPAQVGSGFMICFTLILVWTITDYCRRKRRSAFISQYYCLGGVFWLVWAFSIAQMIIGREPFAGVIQIVAAGWFSHAYVWAWLTPVALATAYYLLPKLLGLPVENYYLSFFGFWCLAFFALWGGTAELIGGPVPVWIQAMGYVCGFLLILPTTSIAINLLHTTFHPKLTDTEEGKTADIQIRRFNVMWNSPTGRFIVTGAVVFPIFGLLCALDSLPHSRELLQFTYWQDALFLLGVYGFYSMIAFGGIYFMLPRLLGREWPSANLMISHYKYSVIGFITAAVCLFWAGSAQGNAIADIDVDNLGIVKASWMPLLCSLAGFLLIFLGQICFLINVLRMACGCNSDSAQTKFGPALLNPTEEGANV